MAIYIKDYLKLHITKDANYLQPFLERSSETLDTRTRSDSNVVSMGHAVLASTDVVTLSAGDITTVLGVYIESNANVVVNCKTSGGAGLASCVLAPPTNGTAKVYAEVNVATSSGVFNITAPSGVAAAVTWVLVGV